MPSTAPGAAPPSAFPIYKESELVFGVVAPVGTNLDKFNNLLKRNLEPYHYAFNEVRLSEVARSFHPDGVPPLTGAESEFQRTTKLMSLGTALRTHAERGDVLALAAAQRINGGRAGEDRQAPLPKTAHVVRSLKHPDEVMTLRRIYGAGFYLIGVNVDRKARKRYLCDEKSCSSTEAETLLERDLHEEEEAYGQRTRETFHLADVFLPLDEEKALQRFLRLVFGCPFETPTPDEYAMFMAFAASLRSADLSRQVGAVIVSGGGDIVAVGANDVPRAEGGLYWPDNPEQRDQRDYVRGADSNDEQRTKMVVDVVRRLRPSRIDEEVWVERGRKLLDGASFADAKDVDDALRRLRPDDEEEDGWLERGRTLLRASPLRDITEYGRAVHAEMEAILSCARSGVSPKQATLFSTTFPCHNCAKHIVAAGIRRVVYVEPYPKSQARELFADSILTADADDDVPSASDPVLVQQYNRRVRFVAFVGVGPRRFMDLFSMSLSSGYKVERKKNGRKLPWTEEEAFPRVAMEPNRYAEREQVAAEQLLNLTGESGETDT